MRKIKAFLYQSAVIVSVGILWFTALLIDMIRPKWLRTIVERVIWFILWPVIKLAEWLLDGVD